MFRVGSFAILLLFLIAPWLRADDYTLELKAVTKESKADAKYPSPEGKAQPRAILTAGAKVPISVQWTLQRTDKGAPAKDVLVHFFVVKQGKLDQRDVPKLDKHVIVESALTMDFKTQDKNEAEITFTVPNPGSYLLRVELKNTAGKEGSEPFAALDLAVK